MEDPPAQQVDIDDENIQDSTVSSNSILSIETVYVKDEFDDEEFNNNIEVQSDEDIFDASARDHINQNINLRADIQMIQYPDPNIRVRNEALQFDDNALNLVKIKKKETVVEKSEATSTCNLPENFRFTGNNQLMHFISAPLRSEETMPIDMLAVNNAYEHNIPINIPIIPPILPSADQEIQQDIDRPSTSRPSTSRQNFNPFLSNERNPIDIVEPSNRIEVEIGEQSLGPRSQEGSSDDSDAEFQPSLDPEPRTTKPTIVVSVQQYVCDNCQVPFSKRCCLITHIFNIHNEGPSGSAEKSCYCKRDKNFECDICHKLFLHKDNMIKHLREHGPKKILTCHFCFKIFKTKASFMRHLNNHNKTHNCNQCKKKFRETSRLKLHIQRKHLYALALKCDVCHKKFKQLCHLKEHKLIHKKVKKIKCNICQAEFTTKAKFHMHQKVHEGDTPFYCEKCKEQFSHNSHHLTHLRVCRGTKTFKCEVCKKKFGQKSTLNRHLRIHKNEKPYTCETCPTKKKFKQKGQQKKKY